MTESLTTPNSCQVGANPDPLPNIIPYGGITLLAGAPNAGKTALIASLARRFRDSTPIYGHQPSALTDIGIVVADRGWDRGAGVWFERAGYPNIAHYSMADDASFDPRSLRRKFERTARLAEFVDKLKLAPGGLLFVDPLGIFLGGDLLNYDSCAVACYEIRVMLRNRGLTLIGAAHSGKLRAEARERYARVQDMILGSTALLGFSDTQCYLAGPEQTGTKGEYCFMWNSHLAAPEFIELVRDERGLFVVAPDVSLANAGRVLALFPEDGTSLTFRMVVQLALKIPLTQRTVQRTLDKLISMGQIVKVRRGVYARALVRSDEDDSDGTPGQKH